VKKHFPEKTSDDPAIEKAVEIIQVPQPILISIAQNDWADRQLLRFATNKLFFLLKTPKGETRALHFRGGKRRNDRLLTPARERVLRRLYASDAFVAKPHPALAAWLVRKEIDPPAVLEKAIERVMGAPALALDEVTRKRARENLPKAPNAGAGLARGLGALGETRNGDECLWAGIWLLSRMDRMAFHRKPPGKRTGDLSQATAQLFFENVYYAVKARNHFPWGKDVSPKDFLQHVLSPRSTAEPLQRWRRRFYEALEPEFHDMERGDMEKAMKLASACCYDFYQYEGATTWEDFGMLTALAVHEGRCEDCSNVECAMIRAVGLPACQAFTPWWASGDGNHAWTVLPCLDGGGSGNGRRAAKVFVKTWDGYEDITDKNTKVTVVEFDTAAKNDARPELRVFNHGQWRVIARTAVRGGKAAFRKVGCGVEFVFLIRVKGETDRLVRVRTDGSTEFLDNGENTDPGEEAFQVEFDKSCVLGEFSPESSYNLFVHTAKGWVEVETERALTGAITFQAGPKRLFRLRGKGVAKRPFTVRKDEAGEVKVVKH
jgi:hypothetical protein